MISKSKKYKTQDGCEVRIYATAEETGDCVHGAYFARQWNAITWLPDGCYRHGSTDSRDLIPVPAIRPWTWEECPVALIVRKKGRPGGAASVAWRHSPSGRGVNVFVAAFEIRHDVPMEEKALSVPLPDLLRDYVRITEDGKEAPCGVEEE